MFTKLTMARAAIVGTVISALALTNACASHPTLSASAVQNAITNSAAPLAEGAKVSATSTFAATSTAHGITVAVHRDASQGVSITTASGKSITVNLPQDASRGQAELSGSTVAYSTGSAAASAIHLAKDGGAQMLSLLANGTAPTRYDYAVGLPQGSALVADAATGGVRVESDGEVILTVDKPWAVDGHGQAVPTHYEVDGTTITQVIDHTSGKFTYPITADPGWGAAFRASVRGTWNFIQCVVGIGVPIGLAWALLSDYALAAWIAGRGPLPASAGRFGYNYLNWVKRTCSAAING